MKKFSLLLITLLLSVGYANSQKIRVGEGAVSSIGGGDSPVFIDGSTGADARDTTATTLKSKGLIFPRVNLSKITAIPNNPNPNSFPTYYDGMIVYNTQDGGVAGIGNTEGALTRGFWYYENKTANKNGGTWKPLGNGADAGWTLAGNAGTDPSTHFIGTTDDQFLAFKVNNEKVVEMGSEAFSALKVISNGNSGLRLPQMTTAQRDAMTNADFKATLEAYGLQIYNMETNCLEYWNGIKWVSMCEGNSQMKINPNQCESIAADGSGCDNEFTITDPACEDGSFSFVIVAGADYASLADVNETDGKFRIVFMPNNSINPRSAMVRVTSSCTGLYKDFLFTQEGYACENLGTSPSITAVPSGKNISLCSEGAVYLSVPSNTPNIDRLIWTRNNIEIARGISSIAVTKEGIYDVCMGFIGCGKLDGNAVNVTKDVTVAPQQINMVVTGNNGMVCGAAGTTDLVAFNPNENGTVIWFKDGILQNGITGTTVTVGIGKWFAVVQDGGCMSIPSETVTVKEDPNSAGGSLANLDINIKGAFCAGGTVSLQVDNASYSPIFIYTWYENNTQIGTGREIVYNVPDDAEYVVIRCRATLAGICASEILYKKTITAGTIPSTPLITGDKQLCSGTATLNAVPTSAGTFTYDWYRNGQFYAATQSITITQGGEYMVTVTDGCTSLPAKITIANESSAIPTVTLIRSNENPILNDMVTYTASINFPPSTNYTWTITNATLVSGGKGTASAVVKFDQQGAGAFVKVQVSNACGTGEAMHGAFNIQPACANPITVSPSTNTMLNIVAGKGITLGAVSATFEGGATPSVSYQWYENTSASNTGGTIIAGATNNTYVTTPTAVGTKYYYCEVKNASCTSSTLASGVYVVKVEPDPASYPIGSGKFEGRTCFDVVETNNGGDCGTLSGRQSQKANFTQTATNTQTYSFTTNGAVSKIRFYAVDQTGLIIETITPESANWATGTNLNGTFRVTVFYKTNLNASAAGKDRANALTAMLYVVYNDNANGNGNDKRLELKASVQDCSCCIGYLAVGKEYVQKTGGYLGGIPDGANFATVATNFTATGKDICFYKNVQSNAASLTNAKASCAGLKDASGYTGWRLPTIAELGSIQSVATNLANQPTSISGTVNMANTPQSGQSAYYWSSTEKNGSVTWGWSYGQSATQGISVTNRVRCVKTQ